MLLRRILPEHHLNADSKDIVKLGMGLIATMSALVLGLLIASAKGSYDTQRTEVTQMSADIVQLDRVLAHYGPQAKEARDLERSVVMVGLDMIWSDSAFRSEKLDSRTMRLRLTISMKMSKSSRLRTTSNDRCRPRRCKSAPK
jgi:hypothetical protein